MSTNIDRETGVESLRQWQSFNKPSLLFPMVGNMNSGCKNVNESGKVNKNHVTTATMSNANVTNSTSSLLRRRHRHWWKVCWIYNNGNLMYQGIHDAKRSNTVVKHRQLQEQENNRIGDISIDRCALQQDFFRTSSTKKSFSEEPQSVNATIMQHEQQSSSNYFHQHQQHQGSNNLLPHKLSQPFSLLMKQKAEQNQIVQFFVQYKGRNWRADQLVYQIPPQDIQILKQTSNEIKFVKNQLRKAQIKPQLLFNKSSNFCAKCVKPIILDSPMVKITVPLTGMSNNGYHTTTDDEDNTPSDNQIVPHSHGQASCYHVDCFTCVTCNQILVDLKAFLCDNSTNYGKKYDFYCYRHFVEIFKPRCQFCDSLIFDEECTEAEGKVWHIGHFCCTECKRSLGGQQYIMADPSKYGVKKNDDPNQAPPEEPQHYKHMTSKPYCLTCFDILYGELCEECGELISCDAGSISHEGRSWHAKNECFRCNNCLMTLLGKPFLPSCDGRIYCSVSCSQEANPTRRQLQEKYDKRKKEVGRTKETEHPRQNECVPDGLMLKAKPNEEMPQNQNQVIAYDKSRSEVNHPNPTQLDLNEFSKRMMSLLQRQTQDEPIPSTHSLLSQMPELLAEYIQNNQLKSGQFNEIIGASVEYGSSISEDEKQNSCPQILTSATIPDQKSIENNFSNDNIPSSSSSSQHEPSFHPLEQQNSNYQAFNAHNFNGGKHSSKSSSSSETTPLILINNKGNLNKFKQQFNPHMPDERQQHQPHDYPNSNQLSDSSKSSKSSNEIQMQNSVRASSSSSSSRTSKSSLSKPMKEKELVVETVDTPSTQSTFINSASAQTTPETEHRTTTTTTTTTTAKSVSFDPNIKEPTKNDYSKYRYNHSKPRKKSDYDWNSNSDDSSSSCSTCSSSSDDYYDYQLDKSRHNYYGVGGTRINYVSNNESKKKKASNGNSEMIINANSNTANNESCVIS